MFATWIARRAGSSIALKNTVAGFSTKSIHSSSLTSLKPVSSSPLSALMWMKSTGGITGRITTNSVIRSALLSNSSSASFSSLPPRTTTLSALFGSPKSFLTSTSTSPKTIWNLTKPQMPLPAMGRFATMSTSTTTTAPSTTIGWQASWASAERPVRIWLTTVAGMVASTVILGGLTRLTESGLSMPDWKLLGQKLPSTEEEWTAKFDLYKATPEYRVLRGRDMTLDEFKMIFYYEYFHRQLGRAIGVTFLLPYIGFAAKGMLPGSLPLHCGVILGGIISQGLIGWWMVKSGLKEELAEPGSAPPRVSQYRLSIHLTSALAIYSYLVVLVLGMRKGRPINIEAIKQARASGALGRFSTGSKFLAALTGTTVFSGAYVAGLDAGLVYNEWPLMGGKFMPDDMWAMTPAWRNFFENTSTVQFDHRTLALLTGATALGLTAYGRSTGITARTTSRGLRGAMESVGGMVLIQIGLGISTLLMYVPVSLASAHQLGAVTLWSLTLKLLYELKRLPK